MKDACSTLDDRSSRFVRDYGRCEKCGTVEGLTNSHIIVRKHLKVRWDPRNLQCLCGGDHRFFTDNPLEFSRWIASSSCGQYTDIMRLQAFATPKYDFAVWNTIYDFIDEHELSLVEARNLLHDQIILNETDF